MGGEARYLSWCCRVGAGGRRSRRLVAGRSRAPGGSAASEEARQELSVRPERSYSGCHVAAHAPPRPPASSQLSGRPGSPASPSTFGAGPGSSSLAPLVLLPRGTCLGPRASASPTRPGIWSGTLGPSVTSAAPTPEEAALG